MSMISVGVTSCYGVYTLYRNNYLRINNNNKQTSRSLDAEIDLGKTINAFTPMTKLDADDKVMTMLTIVLTMATKTTTTMISTESSMLTTLRR